MQVSGNCCVHGDIECRSVYDPEDSFIVLSAITAFEEAQDNVARAVTEALKVWALDWNRVWKNRGIRFGDAMGQHFIEIQFGRGWTNANDCFSDPRLPASVQRPIEAVSDWYSDMADTYQITADPFTVVDGEVIDGWPEITNNPKWYDKHD